jgi:hypothetical protein
MNHRTRALSLISTTVGFLLATHSLAAYKFTVTPTFHPHPIPGSDKPWGVKNFGPVGIGLNLSGPDFTMTITNIEPGSPAEKTGKLKIGQIIESINGRVLQDIDPREILGNVITQAEAKDGRIVLKIKGVGDVLVTIPVMGAYSPTWPLNCAKSDKIVRNLADLIAKLDQPKWGSIIFLLSTGEEKDLAVVKKWIKNTKDAGYSNWSKGYVGPGLCEYYLRTGDKTILPVIQKAVDDLKQFSYNGGWAHRQGFGSFTYSTGSGQLHAAGVHCLTFLMMAKLCGVNVDEDTLQTSLKAFYRFVGHGSVAYGDGLPEEGFRDNGKNGGLAVGLAAAALLDPKGEESIYARARDTMAMKNFYATSWFHSGHTGGGIGEIWHNTSMSLLHKSRPNQYRSFLDTRRWIMDLSRRYDGGIGIAGMTDRYDASTSEKSKDGIDFGTFFALTYTIPRGHLQMYGAPRSKYAVTHPLPVRPWGNENDDIFASLEPAKHEAISMNYMLNENVEKHASLPIMTRMNDAGVSDEELIRYFHHPEYGLRDAAVRAAVNHGRVHLVVPLLKSQDPRVRQAGLLALTGPSKGVPIPQDKITTEMLDLAANMIKDPKESWWVVQEAMYAIKKGGKAHVEPLKNRILELMETDSYYVQMAAVSALAELAADPKYYKELLPKLLARTATFTSAISTGISTRELSAALAKAPKEVQAFADKQIVETLANYPKEIKSPQGMLIPGAAETIRGRIFNIVPRPKPTAQDLIKRPMKTLSWSQSGSDEDLFHFKSFELGKPFPGTWTQITSVDKALSDDPVRFKKNVNNSKAKLIERIANSIKKNPKKPFKTTAIILESNGDVREPGNRRKDLNRTWTGDLLLYLSQAEARRMKIVTVDEERYLLIERGEFKEDAGESYHPGYDVYGKNVK